jgi:hypothetical protein
MSAFRTKLLSLAALTTLFAGASYGQITVTYGSSQNIAVVAGALNLRAEGATELVSPLAFTITNSGPAVAGTVNVYMSAPVTSLTCTFPCSTQATLVLTGVGVPLGLTAGPISGSIGGGGTVVSFSLPPGTTFPAGTVGAPSTTNALVYGVRVNASAVAAGSSLVAVTAQPGVTSNSSSSVAAAPSTNGVVGYVFSTLSTPTISGTPSTFPTTPVNNYNTAQGSPSKPSMVPGFYVSVGASQGAFKLWGGAAAAGTVAGGVYTVQPDYSKENADGNASYGSRVQLAFGNVPTGVTLYVPTSITVVNKGVVLNLTLVSSATGADTATGPPTPTVPPSFTAPDASQLVVTNTTYAPGSAPVTGGVAVYEITNITSTSKVSAEIPVYVTFAPNSLTAASGAITVLESYAPETPLASNTTVPDFAVVTTGALNGSSISVAQTGLLFPFVTSNTGFDTGIALSNTTTDPFGTSPSAGTCSLNFYGTGAPTPNTGVAAPGGSQASGTSNAFLLSSVAPNFAGYMIAVCNYPDAHGFGYIIYNFGQNSGATMGYLALVLQRGPTFAVPQVEGLQQ